MFLYPLTTTLFHSTQHNQLLLTMMWWGVSEKKVNKTEIPGANTVWHSKLSHHLQYLHHMPACRVVPATPLSNPASCLCAEKVNKRWPKVFWLLHPVTYMDGSCLGSGPDLAIDMIWDGQGRGGERKEVVKQWIRDTSLFHAHSLTFTLALTLWLYLSNK